MSRPPKRGIVDPWRVVEPVKADPRKPQPLEQKRVNLSEIDWDADIRVAEFFVFRSRHGSIEVRSKTIATSNDALRELVQCLFQILESEDGPALFEDVHIGFMLHGREWLMPEKEVPASVLGTSDGYVPRAAIYFRHQPYDHGMLRLIKLLNAVQRRPGVEGSDILKRRGVKPLMR